MREAGRYEPCTSRFLEDFLSWKRLVNLLLDGSVVKNQPANAGDTGVWVRSLGWEDTLEEGMATHSSILPWRIPWIEVPGRIQSMGSQRVIYD